jgi:short-subunit dehydrogenase
MARNQPRHIVRRPVVWVVGASRGIGSEIARAFASIGCEVCLSSRSTVPLRTLAKAIDHHGGKAYVYPLDASKPASILQTANTLEKQFGRIDVLVNNAGVTVFKSFQNTSRQQLIGIIQTDLIGPAVCMKAVLPGMMRRRSGWIFNNVSLAAIRTFERSAAYTGAKAGLYRLGQVVREETRDHNIRVVNIVPGATDTTMWSAAMRKKYGSRMMSPKSVAEAILAVYQLPKDVVVEEIIMRPMMGDVKD